VLPGILPTLGLKIFLALVPIVLTLTSVIVAGLPSESAVDFDVGRKFFLFQFVIVFFFLTVIQAMSTGSSDESSSLPIVAFVNRMIDEPKEISTLLGTSIPQVVRFLLLLQCVSSHVANTTQLASMLS
jgi:Calcium-dependent channel, 7TM region, putative phosphate